MIQNNSYSDIFETIELQIPAIQVLEKVINYRKLKLIQMENQNMLP